jgi:hypothetical protein
MSNDAMIAKLAEMNQRARDALDRQVGGDHYKSMRIQPMEFSMANGLDACTHSAIKYLTRKKGDTAKQLEDLDKAIHCIQIKKQLLQEGKI